MPFIELLAPPASPAVRLRATRAVTQGLCDAFAVSADIVTLYFLDVPPDAYAHAGVLGAEGRTQRLFVKVHAYRRGVAERRRAAALIGPALAAAYDVPDTAVALYFLDRAPDEVAHAGCLSADMPAP